MRGAGGVSNATMERSSRAALRPVRVMTSRTKKKQKKTATSIQFCIYQRDVPPAVLAYPLFIAPAAIMPNGK